MIEPQRWVALLDVSPSMTAEDRRRQASFLKALNERLPSNVSLQTVRFGETPRPGEQTRLSPPLLSARGAQRVFLLSDGLYEESPSALLALAEAIGAPIHLPAHLPAHRKRLVAERLKLPERPSSARSTRVTLEYTATFDGKATATLLLHRAGGESKTLAQRQLSVRQGTHDLPAKLPPLKPGLYLLEAHLKTQGIPVLPHRRQSRLVRVGTAPRVLLVTQDPTGGTIGRTLRSSRHQVDTISPSDLPTTQEGLQPYREVIFSDMALRAVPPKAAVALSDWVRVRGGGLLFADAKQALELASWSSSPLDTLFPLEPAAEPPPARPKDEQDPGKKKKKKKKRDPKDPRDADPFRKPGEAAKPVLGLILVIDRSGSMEGKKLTLAKEAAIACAETLKKEDVLGVVAFDSKPNWLVRPTLARHRDQIARRISRLEAGGETHIYRALQAVARSLKGVSCPVKHVVLLSDGHTEPALFRELITSMANEKITISAIGIGEDFDQRLLQQIASWGKGHFNFATDPEQIPQYVIRETKMALRRAAPHRKKPRTPRKPPPQPRQPEDVPEPKRQRHLVNRVQAVFRAPFLVGLPGKLPDLGRIAPTRARPGATVILETQHQQPVLAVWRSGLGRVGIFSGTLAGPDAGEWSGWQMLPRYQAQLVTFLLSEEQATTQQALDGQLQWLPGGTTIRLDLWITGPDGKPRDTPGVAVRETLGGRLLAPPTRLSSGRYRLETESPGPFQCWTVQVGRLEQSYLASKPAPPEQRRLLANRTLLTQIARKTGGRMTPEPDVAISSNPPAHRRIPVDTRSLLAAGLVLWCLAIGLWRVSGHCAASPRDVE